MSYIKLQERKTSKLHSKKNNKQISLLGPPNQNPELSIQKLCVSLAKSSKMDRLSLKMSEFKTSFPFHS